MDRDEIDGSLPVTLSDYDFIVHQKEYICVFVCIETNKIRLGRKQTIWEREREREKRLSFPGMSIIGS